MSFSSESECENSYYDYSYSENSSEDEINEITATLAGIKPYQFETEKKIVAEENFIVNECAISGSSKNKLLKSRVETNDWCCCEKCHKEEREIDCLCCKDVDAISDTQFEGKSCITFSEEFKVLCLNKAVLQNVLVGFNQTKGDYLEIKSTNRSLRFAAYKQFTWWVYQRLGKGNRRVIPSCVLWCIREAFEEAGGLYTNYKEGDRD